MELVCLYEDSSYQNDDEAVDIVAVHGPGGHRKHTWTDPKTEKLWLRDFIPADIPKARILSFGYSVPGLSLDETDDEDDTVHPSDRHSRNSDPVAEFANLRVIENLANKLMTLLSSDRGFHKCQKRPIIFVCHGLGGIIVQQALVLSESYKSFVDIKRGYSIYKSTYAVLFFSTPFSAIDEDTWLSLKTVAYLDLHRPRVIWAGIKSVLSKKKLRTETSQISETIWAVAEHFRQIMTPIQLFFFWEDSETDFGYRRGTVVPQEKAAPNVPNTQRCGIDANYSAMVKFRSRNTSGYRVVLSGVKEFCEQAPLKIKGRWVEAEAIAQAAKDLAASERLGIEYASKDSFKKSEEGKEIRASKNFYKLPSTVSCRFIGRTKEQQEIREAFFDTTQRIPPPQKRFVIHGIGGAGKTELCRKFADDNKERYCAVFTVTAASPELASASLASIGRDAGLSTHATVEQGKDWLSNYGHQNKPWLLIFDNADDPQLELEELFPTGGNGHILITTRNSKFSRHATVGSLKLTGLEEDDAVQLLFDRADISGPWDNTTKEEGRRIARTLGCLARAVVQAASSITCHQFTLERYLPHWEQYRMKRQEKGNTDEEEDKIFAAFDVSLAYLTATPTESCKDALELLKIISFYHFEDICIDIFYRAMKNRNNIAVEFGEDLPLRLFKEAAKRVQPPPALPQFIRQDGQGKKELRIRAAIGKLCSVSFANLNTGGTGFSIHPLLRDWVRDSLDKPMKRFWATIALNILAESVLLPPADAGESHGEFRKDILPHLHSCLTDPVFEQKPIEIPNYQNWWGKVRLYSTAILRPTAMYLIRDKVILVAKCGYLYATCGRFQESLTYLTQVKDLLLQLQGPKHEKTITAMLALAGILWGLGDRDKIDKAIALQKSVVEARTTLFGANHPDTLRAMNHLGKSYWLRGYHQEALTLQEDTVKRMAKNQDLGETHPDTLEAMDHYGVTLGSFLRFQESLEIHLKVLKLRTKVIQVLRQDTLSGMHQENSRPASTNSSSTIEESSYRTNSRDQDQNLILDRLSTLQNLAMAQLDLGLGSGSPDNLDLLQAAQKNMNEVLQRRKQLLGEEHPWTLWAVCNLVKVNVELGLLEESEKMLLKGIPAAKRGLGANHPGVLMGMGELAKVYSRQNRYGEAEKKIKEVLEKLDKARGEDHPDTVFATFKLSNLYKRQGKIEEAATACEDALRKGDMRLTRRYPLCGKIAKELQTLQRMLPPNSPILRLVETRVGIESRPVSQGPGRLFSRHTFGRRKVETW